MRICLFTATFLPKIGGHEMAVHHLARSYIRAGHSAVVLAQHGSRRPRKEEVAMETPYPLARFRKPFSQVWGLWVLRRALARLRAAIPFDLVHAFSAYPTGFAAVQSRRFLKTPVVVTSQGGDIAATSRFRGRRLVMRRIGRALEEADAFTAISQYMRDCALEISPGIESRIIQIPNGVDCAEISEPAKRPAWLRDDRPFILFLGRLHRRKGVETLIRAYASAASRLGEARLTIAGDGPEKETLTSLAKEAGIAGRIHFPGMIQGEDKRWLLQNALCLALPTHTWEGMPVVVLEAMACGRPILGARVGGITDLVREGENGILVRPGDVDDLAGALERLVMDPDRRRLMGRCSKEQSLQYDWNSITKLYLNLFDRLINNRA